VFDVAESSYIEYSSSDTRVATVDQYGLVTAMGIGEATVRATYRKGAETRSMEFSVQLDSLDLNATPNALDFGSQAGNGRGSSRPPFRLPLFRCA
jgi:uncharacterized protein YjdB